MDIEYNITKFLAQKQEQKKDAEKRLNDWRFCIADLHSRQAQLVDSANEGTALLNRTFTHMTPPHFSAAVYTTEGSSCS